MVVLQFSKKRRKWWQIDLKWVCLTIQLIQKLRTTLVITLTDQRVASEGVVAKKKTRCCTKSKKEMTRAHPKLGRLLSLVGEQECLNLSANLSITPSASSQIGSVPQTIRIGSLIETIQLCRVKFRTTLEKSLEIPLITTYRTILKKLSICKWVLIPKIC